MPEEDQAIAVYGAPATDLPSRWCCKVKARTPSADASWRSSTTPPNWPERTTAASPSCPSMTGGAPHPLPVFRVIRQGKGSQAARRTRPGRGRLLRVRLSQRAAALPGPDDRPRDHRRTVRVRRSERDDRQPRSGHADDKPGSRCDNRRLRNDLSGLHDLRACPDRGGAFIGAGATVINGKPSRPLTIGRGSIVGAGSVVTKSVPAGSTVSGNPAQSLRERVAASRREASTAVAGISWMIGGTSSLISGHWHRNGTSGVLRGSALAGLRGRSCSP